MTGFLDADSLYDIGVDLRDAIEAGIVLGPRMSTGGNALLTAARNLGTRLVQGCAVSAIHVVGGKVTGVTGDKGEFNAPVVVNASGAVQS